MIDSGIKEGFLHPLSVELRVLTSVYWAWALWWRQLGWGSVLPAEARARGLRRACFPGDEEAVRLKRDVLTSIMAASD